MGGGDPLTFRHNHTVGRRCYAKASWRVEANVHVICVRAKRCFCVRLEFPPSPDPPPPSVFTRTVKFQLRGDLVASVTRHHEQHGPEILYFPVCSGGGEGRLCCSRMILETCKHAAEEVFHFTTDFSSRGGAERRLYGARAARACRPRDPRLLPPHAWN